MLKTNSKKVAENLTITDDSLTDFYNGRYCNEVMAKELHQEANSALYEAKQNSRNQYKVKNV